MQYHAFLIKYAEIGTKGKNRYMFEDALMKQIRYALKNVDGQFDVTKEAGRIYVNAEGSYDYEDAVEAPAPSPEGPGQGGPAEHPLRPEGGREAPQIDVESPEERKVRRARAKAAYAAAWAPASPAANGVDARA